ncbi:MAG: hypothetical protein FWE03_03645 [Firmicutes bacterium]|nr:hypothetical protein [Bacillota bacterium]
MNDIINEILDEEKKPNACSIKIDNSALKQRVFNWFVVAFSLILTIVALITFFVAFTDGYTGNAAAILGSYVLSMLLAAPTIKVFLDKCTCPLLKWFNIITIILIFVAILIPSVLSYFNLAGFIG